MTLPPFASFPQASLRENILPEEWEACLDAWIVLAQGHLLLSPGAFSQQSAKNESLVEFLVSYVREASSASVLASNNSKAKFFRRDCFLLTHRLLTGVPSAPSELLEFAFLGDLSTVYARSPSLHKLLEQTWRQEKLDMNPQMQEHKSSLTEKLEHLKNLPLLLDEDLRRVAALLKASYDYGQFLMTGSDLLDSLATTYVRVSAEYGKKIMVVAYLALTSLMEGAKPNVSLLIDHLYSLKSTADLQQTSGTQRSSLLDSVVSSTFLLRKLQDRIKGSDAARAKPLIASLEALRASHGPKPKRPIKRKINKGKLNDRDEYGHGALGEVHVHKMSLITQVQDLFSDLGSGFIVKLLDEYDDEVEQVIAHLLEDSLPAHLKQADQAEDIHIPASQNADIAPDLAPRATPPLLHSRRNVFDDDDFDKLAIDTSRLNLGRKNQNMTADNILSDRSNAPNKAAILSALAAFDSDDDERDDTYDVEDVGGTVDSALPGSDEVDADLRDKNEEALFSAYKMSPGVFERNSNTRRGKARAALKSETGMTDEAIEGWAIMISRDPRRIRRLEAKFSTFSGAQRELAPTAYRESPAGSGTEESDGGGRGGRGGYRGRGRGRGGNVGGPVDDKLARQRKDAQKGSRANHNRRDQRARKMARGGFAG